MYFVHHPEDAINTLLRRVLFFGQSNTVADHLVDAPDDRQHLISRYEAVLVKIVQFERP